MYLNTVHKNVTQNVYRYKKVEKLLKKNRVYVHAFSKEDKVTGNTKAPGQFLKQECEAVLSISDELIKLAVGGDRHELEHKVMWDKFKNLWQMLLQEQPEKEEWENYGVRISGAALRFIRAFKKAVSSTAVTPYLHILAVHVPAQAGKHGNLLRFSCFGLEHNQKVRKV